MNNEQVINSSVPSTDRYTNIPSLGHTQVLPTEVIVQAATQVIPSTNNSPQQIVPVEQIFKPHEVKQQVVQQPYQAGAYVTQPPQQQVVQQVTPPQVQVQQPVVQQQVVQQPQQVVQQPVVQQQVVQQNVEDTPILIDDSMLQKEFIGKNYEKIMNSQFNLFAFFLNFVYYFYRKMYIYGIALSLIMFFILLITRNIIIYIVMCGLVGVVTNSLYKHFSLKKVQIIREDNEDKNIDEIKELCRDEGNTSIGSVFFGLVVEGVAGVCLGIVIFIFLLSKVNI